MLEKRPEDPVNPDITQSEPVETDIDLEKAPTAPDALHQLSRERSHISHHELHGAVSHHVEADAAQYERFSSHKKVIITCVVSVCGFLAPISSTTILAAIPEVAATYHSTGSIINLSNAMYLIFMGIAPCVWGPLSQIYGRRWICVASAALFFVFSVGTALAPSLAAFFIFRILTAFQGTSFLIVGSSCIGDIYAPIERGTALGWFLSGALVGPAFGPFIGGIIVTFKSWRAIFWLQAALGGLAFVLVLLFLPETIPSKKYDEFRQFTRAERTKKILHLVNPFRVAILLFEYPNLIVVGGASGSLVWNMYSLLTPIRYVLNPRFHLDSPIQSGLFYIAPGIGYLVGSFFGGRWADRVVKKWIKKRGRRNPEDRLKSCLSSMGVVIPGCMLIYGWSVDKAVGGVPLPVVAMFVQGVGQLFCFPSLNTYCLDVMQAKGRSSEVIAGNYMVRYLFAAAASGCVLPAIEKIGVGWFSTISCGFLLFATGLVILTTIYGEEWRLAVDGKKKEKKLSKRRRAEKRDEHL